MPVSPKTPVSAETAYCSVPQILNWFDARTVGDLVRDDGSRATPTQLQTDKVLQQMLQDASGEIEAACLVGGRYTVADLLVLNGNSSIFLAGIVAGLAYMKLMERRPEYEIPEPKRVDQARKALEALSVGEAIFALQETSDAGRVEEDVETVADVDNRRMVSWHAARYLGLRANRYPLPSQGFGGGFCGGWPNG
jgi:hypothetical protein